MLEIIKYQEDEYNFPSLLVLGCFDAIHKGHVELLKKAALEAKINGLDLGVMLFKNGKDAKHILSLDERLKILEGFKAKFVLLIDYTDEFKATKPLDFLQAVEEKINVKAYMSGKDFRFGFKAAGKGATLKKYADDDENGVWYKPVKELTYGADKISTTLIKEKLSEGEVELANELLGRNFSVTGEVVGGAERGKTLLGFPTANVVYPEDKADLMQGVYKVNCIAEGQTYCGIANYGPRPTFGDDEVFIEVYICGFDGNLYGKTVTIEFLSFIREIAKYDSAEQLKAQLVLDMKKALPQEYAAMNEVSTEESVAEAAAETPAETAETVEEATEEVAEEVVEETAEEATEEVVEETAEETTEEVVEEATEEVVEETAEEATEEVAEEVAEEVVEETAEESTEEVVEEVVEETTEETTEEVVEETAEEATEDAAEEVAEESEEEESNEEAEESEEESEESEESEEEAVAEQAAEEEVDVAELYRRKKLQQQQQKAAPKEYVKNDKRKRKNQKNRKKRQKGGDRS